VVVGVVGIVKVLKGIDTLKGALFKFMFEVIGFATMGS
jgi:hypothetical protein